MEHRACYLYKVLYHHRWMIALLLFSGIILSVGTTQLSLFDLDELYFAEITREMIITKDYGNIHFNFEPLYEKPPLFFWIQAASMWIWGVNEIGARFPNIVCGLLTIATLYHMGKKYQGVGFGMLWSCLYISSFLPHFYFKSGIIDPIFNYFVGLSTYFLARYAFTRKNRWGVLAGIFIWLALLTKGPIGILIPYATILLGHVALRLPTSKLFIAYIRIAITVLSCWLIPTIYAHGVVFVQEFLKYHLTLCTDPVATHQHPWYYHCLILFVGCFPCSLFTILKLFQNVGECLIVMARGSLSPHTAVSVYMQALLAVILVTFSCVGTKIVHYSSMAYFPITFFAARFLYALRDTTQVPFIKPIAFLFLVLGMIKALCLMLIPWMMLHKSVWMAWVNNPNVRYALEYPMVWNYWDSMSGVVYACTIALSFYYLLYKRLIPFVCVLVMGHCLALTIFVTHIGAKIETYAQKPVIDFCKNFQEKEGYLVSVGFKAAAPLFYAQKSANRAVKEKELPWLLTGAIDKPCFYIVYKSDVDLLTQYTDITHIKDEGCFSFYQRLPNKEKGGV